MAYMTTCGHQYEGINQNQYGVCPDCQAKVFGDFADLTGTDKQISWATDIRAQQIKAIVTRTVNTIGHDFADKLPEKAITVYRKLAGLSEAKFWIDHRNDEVNQLLKAVMDYK
jgi:hypothetical protein